MYIKMHMHKHTSIPLNGLEILYKGYHNITMYTTTCNTRLFHCTSLGFCGVVFFKRRKIIPGIIVSPWTKKKDCFIECKD